MSVINTNIKGLFSQSALKSTERAQATAMQQLSTGKRINSAKDDAAGMAIATRMTQQIRSLDQAVRNAGDAISLIQTAEGATNAITDMMQRMRELAIQAINDTNANEQRSYLDLEFQQLKQEIVRVADMTEWNGFPVLNGSAGVQQGPKPVFKIESSGELSTTINYSPVTASTSEDIEQQKITFSAIDPSQQTLTFGAASAASGLTFQIKTFGEASASPVITTVSISSTAADAAAVGSAVATALNMDFASANITRQAVDNKDGTVTIIYRDADGVATNAVFTAGASATGVNFTGGSVTGSGSIYVGGVTVSVTAGMSKTEVAEAVFTALSDASAYSTAIIKNNDDGSLAITYAESDGDVDLISFTAGAAIGVTSNAETLQIADTELDFANNGGFLKAGSLSFSIDPTPLKQEILALGPVSAGGTMTVAGVTVNFTSSMSAPSAAAVVRSYLIAETEWNFSASGRLIVDNEDGTLSITYAAEDGDAAALTVTSSASANVVSSVIPVQAYGSISARFDVQYGDPVTLTGQVDFANGEITFAKESVAQVDEIALSGSYTVGDVITINVGAHEYAYRVGSADTTSSLLATHLVADMLDDVDLSEMVTVALNRDGNVTLTAKEPGVGFVANAVVTRQTGSSGSIASDTLTANVNAGNNATVISDDLTVSLLNADGDNVDVTYRAPNATIDVGRSFAGLTALRNSDLIINGQSVSVSLPASDKVSTSNPAGSALAKAQAINKISGLTGVKAVVQENVFTGTRMVAGDSVSGTISINGYTSPVITTTENNPRESRAIVVEAINRMTARTGVVAINTNDDLKGIVLKASDGRNIEVFFNSDVPDQTFADRTGLKQGLQASVYALESKIETAIKIGSSSTGDITRSGLTQGDYVDNETVVVIDDRLTVNPPVAQVNEVALSGTAATGETYSVTINGRTKTFKTTASSNSFEDIRASLISEINADARLGVTATASNGNNLQSIFITARNPGVEFTISVETDANDAYMDQSNIIANASAAVKKLNTGDLVINGVAIPGSDSLDDIRTTEGVLASRKDSSAISIAAAINSQFEKTGVKAEFDNAVITGSNTITGLPGVFPETGKQSLFINGIEVEVTLTENEPLDVRRENVMNAINLRTYSHGVIASNNGAGLTLSSSDGRNVAAWFDADVEGLSAASFGLDAGGSVSQETSITLGGTVGVNDTATVTINGMTITSEAAGTATPAALAARLMEAIQQKINDGFLTNVTVSRDEINSPEKLVVTSTVPGTAFSLSGAASSDADATVVIAAVDANSEGENIVSAIRGGDRNSTAARTVYSSLKLVSDKEFTVESGANGFGVNSNFSSLGFKEGTFGGRSSVEMSPPRVGRLSFQVGAKSGQEIYIDLADFGKGGPITSGITGDVDSSLENMINRINTREGAQSVLSKLDVAMDKINQTRAVMGAVMNRLQYAMDNLSNVSTNSSASRSQIEDADYAKASTELARTQIMQQAGTAVLAQANMSQQTVLKLLG